MSKRSKLWLAAVAVLLAGFILSALVSPRSFQLTALSDIVQSLLLGSGAAAFFPLARRSQGRMRLFWSLITLGISFQLTYQLLWTFYEIILQRDVPDPFAGDVILFLHIVPLMAALALRPHVPRDEYTARVGRLDFMLLFTWWFYLYVLIVIPWQYVMVNVPIYDRNLNAVYLAEKLAFLAGLVACWATSKGAWKNLYASLLALNVCYAASSTVANWALARKVYYSGSLYDIPLVVPMAFLTWIGLRCKAEQPDADDHQVSTAYGVWIARCSMIAVFSLPLFAAWSMSDGALPTHIRVFRLALTLVAAFFLGLLVFLRQHLLDRELFRLLDQSRESFANLNRLQAQVLQSEKLASIGQLVGGAAHELNNPITAMLGYSDMLMSTPLTPEQQKLAAKIGQYVRRTKSLVASLISFARQAPAPKSPVDLNTLARTAVKLTQSQWEILEVEVQTHFDPALPKVLGDSNQLLHVCQQLIGNCLHLLSDQGGRVLTVSTEQIGGAAVLQIATESMPSPEPVNDPSLPGDALAVNQEANQEVDQEANHEVNHEEDLGLSACQGILQEHSGQLSRERRPDGVLLLRVELPITESAPAKPKPSTVPVLWQSRPFA